MSRDVLQIVPYFGLRELPFTFHNYICRLKYAVNLGEGATWHTVFVAISKVLNKSCLFRKKNRLKTDKKGHQNVEQQIPHGKYTNQSQLLIKVSYM